MSDINVFNRQHVRQHRRRAQTNFFKHSFLFDWCEQQVLDRLQDIAKKFPTAFIIGSRLNPAFIDGLKTAKNIGNLTTHDFIDDNSVSEMLPIEPQSADLIISVLDLHTVNDLPGALLQIKSALKPDGLFMGCMLGGETLYELRDTLMQTEIQMLSGASPRVAPFADKQQMGALLQRAGFALPVIDSEIIRVSYTSMFNLMADLRGMGESNALNSRRKQFTGSGFFAEAASYYQNNFAEPDGRVTASFEMIFLIGWSPHDSQQKPLRRGSADHSLAEFLK
jgi:SAM-dependent methyltransferase